METESMRRKGRQEHGRVCSEIQASIRETYNHTRTHTQTLSSRAGGGRRDCALPSCGRCSRCGRRGLFVRRRVDHPAVH